MNFLPEVAQTEQFKGQGLISIATPIIFDYDGMSEVTGHLTEGNPIYTGDLDWEGIHVWSVEYNGGTYYVLPALVTKVQSDSPIEVLAKVIYRNRTDHPIEVETTPQPVWHPVVRTIQGPSGTYFFQLADNWSFIRISDALGLRNE